MQGSTCYCEHSAYMSILPIQYTSMRSGMRVLCVLVTLCFVVVSVQGSGRGIPLIPHPLKAKTSLLSRGTVPTMVNAGPMSGSTLSTSTTAACTVFGCTYRIAFDIQLKHNFPPIDIAIRVPQVQWATVSLYRPRGKELLVDSKNKVSHVMHNDLGLKVHLDVRYPSNKEYSSDLYYAEVCLGNEYAMLVQNVRSDPYPQYSITAGSLRPLVRSKPTSF